MIEIRRLLGPGLYITPRLQYRQTINDDEPTSERLWSEWIDVPDVLEEENQ